jgi:ketosteroid isomerase-like protein
VNAEATVRRWFEAFNSRDLETMLACMHPHVDFHPLRLHGLGNAYYGHDGVRKWFTAMSRMEHHHRIDLSEVRETSDGQLVALGTLSAADPSGPSSFWALESFAEEKIVTAYHYITKPDLPPPARRVIP